MSEKTYCIGILKHGEIGLVGDPIGYIGNGGPIVNDPKHLTGWDTEAEAQTALEERLDFFSLDTDLCVISR